MAPNVTMSPSCSIILLMSATNDKFEAAKTIVETIKTFDSKEQEMILRWAAESLGIAVPSALPSPASESSVEHLSEHGSEAHSDTKPSSTPSQNIKAFVASKGPKSDVQFAATIAYYHQFVAPKADRKTNITQDDLLDACRTADWPRPPNPYQTLNNAFHLGLLDRPEKGAFSINSVGENLVAMALPGDASASATKKRVAKKPARRPAKNRVVKKAVKKTTNKASSKAKGQKA